MGHHVCSTVYQPKVISASSNLITKEANRIITLQTMAPKRRTAIPSGAADPNHRKRGDEDDMEEEDVEGVVDEDNELVFEDPFGDEFEEEDVVDDEQDDEDGDGDGDDAHMDEDGDHAPKQVWRPGIDVLGVDEELDYDPSAYITYHSLKTEWPCLSFDVIRDNLGEGRNRVSYLLFIHYVLDSLLSLSSPTSHVLLFVFFFSNIVSAKYDDGVWLTS